MKQLEFVPRILWLAMFFAQLLFVFLAQNTHPFNFSTLADDLLGNSLFLPLGFVAVNTYLAAWIVPSLIAKAVMKKNPTLDTPEAVMKLGFVPFIIRLALAESVTMFGFVISMQSKNAAAMAPFFLLAMTVFVFNFPSYQLFRSWFRR